MPCHAALLRLPIHARPRFPFTRSSDDIWEQVTRRQHGWEYQKFPLCLVDRWARY
jgi:hypothetical protein